MLSTKSGRGTKGNLDSGNDVQQAACFDPPSPETGDGKTRAEFSLQAGILNIFPDCLAGASLVSAACRPRQICSVAEFMMFNALYQTIRQHLMVYRNFVLDQWRDLNPVTYSIVLIAVMVFGWLLMKSHSRR